MLWVCTHITLTLGHQQCLHGSLYGADVLDVRFRVYVWRVLSEKKELEESVQPPDGPLPPINVNELRKYTEDIKRAYKPNIYHSNMQMLSDTDSHLYAEPKLMCLYYDLMFASTQDISHLPVRVPCKTKQHTKALYLEERWQILCKILDLKDMQVINCSIIMPSCLHMLLEECMKWYINSDKQGLCRQYLVDRFSEIQPRGDLRHSIVSRDFHQLSDNVIKALALLERVDCGKHLGRCWTVPEDTIPTNIYTSSYLSHRTA